MASPSIASPSTDIIRRGAFVTGIPFITEDRDELQDKLEIHFQNSKTGGGGDVESIVCRIQGDIGKAIVIFKSEEDLKNVLDHTVHTFCDSGELQVKALPQVFSVLYADIEEYYWKLLKVPDVQNICKLFPKVGKNLSHVDCDFEQLKDLTLELLNYGPVGESVRPSKLDHESMMQIASKCLEVTGIPYITDDKEELDGRLRQYFKTMTGKDLAGLACGVQGDLKRAIAVFGSRKDMELVMKEESNADRIMFYGERLTLVPLPQVMKVHATFDDFYIGLIPKLKKNKLVESNPSINKKNFQLTGSLFEADRAIKCLLEMIGIKEVNSSEVTTIATLAHTPETLSKEPSHEVADSASDNSSKLNKNSTDNETDYDQREGKNRTPEVSRYPGKAIKDVKDEISVQPHENVKQGASPGVNKEEDISLSRHDLRIEQSKNTKNPKTESTGSQHSPHDSHAVGSVYKSKGDRNFDQDNADVDQTPPPSEEIQRHEKNVSEFAEIRIPLTRSLHISAQSRDETNHSNSLQEEKETQQGDAKPGSESTEVERDPLSEGFAQVDKIKFEYMLKTKADELDDITTIYGVRIDTKIHRDKDPSTLVVTMERIKKKSDKEPVLSEKSVKELTKARGDFMHLYSQIIPDITVQTFTCSGMKLPKITKVVETINRKFADTLVVQEGSEVIFCGNESTIKNVMSEFKLSAGISERTDLEITVNYVVFQFLYEHSSEFKKIQRKYNLTFELKKDPSSSTECGVFLKPGKVGNQKKKVADKDVSDAKESFISLYQTIFPSLRRTTLQLHGVPQVDIRKALAAAVKNFPKIILTPTDDGNYIFCTDEANADVAIQCFRTACGIQPTVRKLKKPDQETASSFVTLHVPGNASKHGSEARSEYYPSSVFSTNEGLQIIAITGDITKQQVDAIVNAANSSLKHGGGVAKAISTAAGPNLQKDCDSISLRRTIKISECVETKGYNLPCQTVIHAVGPTFSNYDKNFDHNLKKTFLSVLHHANGKGSAKAVAIPLISSGNFGGPLDRCTEALTTAIFEFSKERKTPNLHQVYLVNIQEKTTLAIQQSLQKRFPATFNHQPIGDTLNQSDQGEVQKSYLTKKGLKIVVAKGDITKTTCDVIVNAANENLSNHKGVAKALSSAAGPELQQECNAIIGQRQNLPLQIGEVVETNGYNLTCKKVAHVVGPRNKDCPSEEVFYSVLKATFLSVLKYTNLRIEAATVALPLISSGVFGGSKVTCSKALFDAVREFAENETTLIMKTLLLINIDDEATNAIVEVFDNLFDGNVSLNERVSAQNNVFKTTEGIELEIKESDITSLTTHAIINPTDSSLAQVGMVSKAIKAKAGPQLQQQCNEIIKKMNWESLKPGQVVYTSGGDLPCKYVLHTVSPTYYTRRDSKFEKQLKETLIACFEKADHIKAVDIGLPLIGSGTSGAPADICISSLIQAIASVSKSRKLVNLKRVVVVSTKSGLIDELKKAFDAQFSDVLRQPSAIDLHVAQDKRLSRNVASNIQDSHPQFLSVPRMPSPLIFEAENDIRVIVILCDITKYKADVLLTSADEKLRPGDDLSNLINEEAGPELQNECKQIIKSRKNLKPGDFVATEGFKLPYKKVVHFVKPQSSSSWEETLMKIMLHIKTTLKATTLAVSTSSMFFNTRSPSGEALHIDVLAKVMKRFSKLSFDKTVKSISIVCTNDEDFLAIDNEFAVQFKPISVGDTSSISMTVGLDQAARRQIANPLQRDTQLTGHSNIIPQAMGTHPSQTASGSHQYPSQPTQHSMHSTGIKYTHISQPSARSDVLPFPLMTSNATNVSDMQNPGQTKHTGFSPNVTPSSTTGPNTRQQLRCLICKVETDVKKLECCEHTYCFPCIIMSIAPKASCRECKRLYCVAEEKTLKGNMTYYFDRDISLPDSEVQGAFVIVYDFPPGKQGFKDPRPGRLYNGTLVRAYLPYTPEGGKVVRKLRTAFIMGKLFTIKQLSDQSYGVSLTNLIPHKLGKVKGEDYPDRRYMADVQKALNLHVGDST